MASAYPMFYIKVCEDLYPRRTNETWSDYICNDFDAIQSDIEIQKSSTNWFMYIEFAKFIPNLLGTMFLASFGDRYGRKIPMLVAVASLLVYMSLFLVFVTVYSIPMFCILIVVAVTSLGGQWVAFVSCEFCEVADYVTNKNKLTVRYAILAAFIGVGNVVGGNIAPFLLTYVGLQWNTLFGIGLVVISFFSILILFPTKPSMDGDRILVDAFPENMPTIEDGQVPVIENEKPATDGHKMSVIGDNKILTTDNTNASKHDKTFGWLKEGLGLYKSAWRTLNKTRQNHGRIHLLIYCIVGTIYTSQDDGLESIRVLYVYHSPLSWSPQLYSQWAAAMNFCQLSGSILGAILLKKFTVTDTMILMISLKSAIAKMLLIGIGQKTWIMFISLVAGCLSTVGFSALRSLVIQLGSGKESGELLSLLNLSLEWCVLFSALVFNNMYAATLIFYPGFPWLFEAFLLLLCVFTISIVHVQMRKNFLHAGKSTNEETPLKNS